MKLLLTGATGFVGKYLVAQILSATDYKLVLPIRPKKEQTGRQRFQKEFVNFTLFGTDRLQEALRTRVTVLEGDVGSLTASDLETNDITAVLHNAANVNFFEDIKILKKDNVESVELLARLVQDNSRITRFLYVSTCYVHPKDGSSGGAAKLLPEGLSQDRFINSYAYSKYLAEGALVAGLSRISPEILRLSIVGAPLGYFSAHPCRGAAHLSMLTSIFDNRLPYVWIPHSVRYNILPVDVVVDQILTSLSGEASSQQVKQLCAPPENPSYHLSLKEFSSFLTDNYKNLLKNTILSTVDDYKEFLETVKGVIKIPDILSKILKANQVLRCIDHTPWFECSIPKEQLPDISSQKHIHLTCTYVLRGIQERKLKVPGGIPLTNSDRVMAAIENPTINAEISLPQAVRKASPAEALEYLYHANWTDRKGMAILDSSTMRWVYRQQMPRQKDLTLEVRVANKEAAHTWALQHPIPLNIGARWILFRNTEATEIVTCIFQMNHIYTDGMGKLIHADSILECLAREFDDGSAAGREPSSKELPLWEDIWIGIKHTLWLLYDAVRTAFSDERPREKNQSVTIFETATKAVPVRQGMTFTESYAKDLVDSQSDMKTVRLSIPANTLPPLTRMKEPSQNHTALYYADFPVGQSDSEFKESFKIFRSMTAKWLSLLVGGLMAVWLPWLLKKCISTVDCIFTSMNVPGLRKDLEPKIILPIQEHQKIGACALTMETTTYHCITARGGEEGAAKIQKEIEKLWAARSQTM